MSATDSLIEIPARGGKATRVKQGQTVRVVNTHGNQVVDTWAFNATDLHESMSMEATRATRTKLCLEVGDSYVSNHRRAMLTVLEDSSPGRHDTLMAACDRHRYTLLGHDGYHDNCTDNLTAALAELDLQAPKTPSPLNLFMNIPWTLSGTLSFDPPLSKVGDYVLMRAEMDLVVAFSACPQDMLPINGELLRTVEAHFELGSS
ncbi:MAG: hypothetical protein ACI8W7_001852 [Gammaproteobacteria bacterium]|jgi:uncharacterized protein YcgI (DUF1989 family)